MFPQTAYKVDAEVQENGKLDLKVPLPTGARVVVFVIEASETFKDLLEASESSLCFWDNPYDEEDWSNV